MVWCNGALEKFGAHTLRLSLCAQLRAWLEKKVIYNTFRGHFQVENVFPAVCKNFNLIFIAL
jgi:hypothetical protein